MTGQPTVQVLLDDGTGTFPTDVSTSVMLNRGITKSGYGRTDEFSQGQPATLGLTLDNTAGTFTTTIKPAQRIRVKVTKGATTRDWFTGSINSLDLEWPGGGQTQAEVTITAADPLADMGRLTLRSLAQEAILASGPAAYYPLAEAAGSSTAGDATGQQSALTTLVQDASQSFTFGTELGLVDGSTGVGIKNTLTTMPNGAELHQDNSPATWSASSIQITFVFVQAAPAVIGTSVAVGSTAGLGVNSSGFVSASILGASVVSPNTVTDGMPHVITLQLGGGLTTDLWIDGIEVDTDSVVASTFTNSTIKVGGSSGQVVTTTYGHFAYGPRVPDATVQDIHRGLMTSFLGETTTARATRLATYAGVTLSTSGMSNQTMSEQDTSGKSAFDAMLDVANAEGGVLFANGTGNVVLQGRYYRSNKTSVDLTLTNDELEPDAKVTYDTQQLVNQVSVTRPEGAAQVVQDATSITTNGVYGTTLDLLMAFDSDALNAAQWLVASHKNPSIRLSSVTFDLGTLSLGEQIHAREVGDRLLITPLPSQAWASAGAVILEGWSETITHEEWSRTANLLPVSLWTSFILDSATLGVLDSATPINY